MHEAGWSKSMTAALAEARAAPMHGDVPIGAVLVDSAGVVVASDHNRREERSDPIAHAEILVLQAAAAALGDWRLTGCTLVVTLEPCAMCAMAAVWARVDRIVYGAPDPKAGAAWSLYNIPQDERLNHHCDLVDGVLAEECRELLESFFRERRS
jgi:tRNA(adenine34) deaminase